MEEGGKRIKVRFEEEQMVSEEEEVGPLRQCWFLVSPDVRTIADLVRDIVSAFRLRRSCPDGILLFMEDFSLPLSQPICLIKDGDVLSIKKRKDPSKANADLEKLAKDPNTNDSDNLNGHTQVCIGGVKLLALEEFEEESGGYQSEREDELDSMDEGIDSRNNLLSARCAKWKLKPIADEHSEGKKQLSHEHRGKKPECQKMINGTKPSWQEKKTDGERDSKPLDTSKKKKKRKGNELLYPNGEGEKLHDKRDSRSVDIKKKKKMDKKHLELSVEEVKTDDDRTMKPVDSSRKKKKRKGKELLDPSVEKWELYDKRDMSKGTHKEKKKRKEEEASESSAEEEHLENAVQGLSKKKALDGSVQKKRKLQGKMQSSMEKIDDESSESEKEVTTKKGNSICTTKISKHFVDGVEIKENEERRKSNHYKEKKPLPMLTKDQLKEGKENCESPAGCFEGKKPPKTLEKEAEVANVKSKHRGTVREDIGEDNTFKEVEIVKKPSRSSMRKKAKRRWKRDLAAVALAEAQGRSIHHTEIRANEKQKGETQYEDKKPEIHCPNVDDDDIEAEEERLPIVVRPGHIRFQDDGANAIKTDMQTQYDGEQSIIHKQDEKTQQHLIRDIRLEELPLLTRLPQEGDTLAYRLVELTAWMCPELSDFRVGQVVSFDTGSSTILLNSLEEYPIKLNNEQQIEDEENTFSLYNDDGSLESVEYPENLDVNDGPEIDLASLVDVRIVEESCITKKINERLGVTKRSEDNGLPKSDQAEPKCEGLLSSSLMDSRIIKESLGGTKSIDETLDRKSPESDHTTILTQALKQVQEAFENKRKEIMHSMGSDPTKDEAMEMKNKDSLAKRSYKTIRASALGPTLALLRNQNVL